MRHVVRFRDSTNIETVRKSLLAHGYRAHGDTLRGPSVADAKDAVAAGVATSIGRAVRFYPGKHLMVSSTKATSTPVLPKPAASLGAHTQVRSVVSPIHGASYVSISAGGASCVQPSNAGPALTKLLKPLGHVTASAAAVLSDTKSIATTAYSSPGAATRDLAHRKALLQQSSPVMNEPYQSIGHFVATRKASTLRYAISAKPRVVPQMVRTRDTPWAMCASKASRPSSS